MTVCAGFIASCSSVGPESIDALPGGSARQIYRNARYDIAPHIVEVKHQIEASLRLSLGLRYGDVDNGWYQL